MNTSNYGGVFLICAKNVRLIKNLAICLHFIAAQFVKDD